jgi:hypothetical protein
MGSQWLRHNAAFAGAQALLDMVAPALLPAERKDFRDEAYHILVAMLEKYDLLCEREAARLAPSRN